MKIGILTQPLKSNYGCVLQNYAMHAVLKHMGHEPLTVRTRQINRKIRLRKWIAQRVKFLAGKMEGKHPQSWSEIGMEYSTAVSFRQFMDRYIRTTEPMYRVSPKKIYRYGFDAYIVGSDQVWKPAYNGGGLIYDMYLGFADRFEGVRRVAYAASFGVDKWEYSQDMTAACRSLAKRFDAISVREESGIRLCKDNLDVNAVRLIDPTMLLSADDYRALIKDEAAPQGEILVYVLDMDDKKREMIDAVGMLMGKKVFYIGEMAAEKGEPLPSLESWLAGFNTTEYVITDSFHGSAFSLIFNKPFISLSNVSRGLSRFESLLSTFGLTGRLWTAGNYDAEKIMDVLTAECDWKEINRVMDTERDKAFSFLKKGLDR